MLTASCSARLRDISTPLPKMEGLPSGSTSRRPRLKLLATCTVINVLKAHDRKDLEGNPDLARLEPLVDDMGSISSRPTWRSLGANDGPVTVPAPKSPRMLSIHGQTLFIRPDLLSICHAVAGPSHCWRQLALIIASWLRAGALNDDQA